MSKAGKIYSVTIQGMSEAVNDISDLQAQVERLRVFETYVMHTDQDAYRKLKGKVIE